MRAVFLIILLSVCVSCGGPRQPSAPVPVSKVDDIAISATYVSFHDVDPVEWTNKKPWQYPIHGIDVSWHNGDIDWRQVRNGGVNFAFIKATEGGDHLDVQFKENWRAARRAGVLRGAYHFYYFCRTAREQANWFIENVPRDATSLPPVLDMEWNSASKTCRLRPSPAKVRSEMKIFLSRVTQYYGKRPVIYVTPNFYEENQLWRVRGYDFWLRTVAAHPAEKYPNQDWAFWQYSSSGRVAGLEDNVDLNVFSGSVDSWKTWVSRNR